MDSLEFLIHAANIADKGKPSPCAVEARKAIMAMATRERLNAEERLLQTKQSIKLQHSSEKCRKQNRAESSPPDRSVLHA